LRIRWLDEACTVARRGVVLLGVGPDRHNGNAEVFVESADFGNGADCVPLQLRHRKENFS
jgi:hypothetical protein